ncbi:hypothetical protein D3C80_1393550 [compost metagenome]
MVYGLRQQGPAGFTEVIEMFKRTVAGLPVPSCLAHQTAVNFRLHRQPRQFVWRDRVNKVREGIFQNHRFFLPVFL